MFDLGIGIDIAGSVILLVLVIIGAVKAWPYRKTDRAKFTAIYKPYKYWGFGIWLVCNFIAMMLFYSA